jgi:hypothetical protein
MTELSYKRGTRIPKSDEVPAPAAKTPQVSTKSKASGRRQ